MDHTKFASAHSITGRLALFFVILSLVIGLVTSGILSYSLTWSEDKVGKRLISIDKDDAVVRYNNGETGSLQLNKLTTAYDEISLIPHELQALVRGRSDFLGEIEENNQSRMVYIGQHKINGQMKTIILLSNIDKIELSGEEFWVVISIVVAIVTLLLVIFGVVLSRLSQTLISPMNALSEQLEQNSRKTESPFVIPPNAAVEFHTFANHLNHYRNEINTLIKREQAFARYASHELRTPLTIVQGANKLLQRGDKTEFQQRQLQRIEDATFQMTSMVDALLSLVRYEKNHEEIDTRTFDEHELHKIINNNHQYTANKPITIEVEVKHAVVIQATPAIMNMIIGNLIRNAINATNQGKIKVLMDEGSLTILDNGQGLENKNNAPQTLLTPSSGHGLGLLIVDELCQRYQWSFKLTNRPTIGCQAQITFNPDGDNV
ncbi:sensor histidine kinase [Psychromonas sp. PT13]|uniref:sensor histidine kinase n=1 Tax=Psychromonas sp. PT13 TaxID=3439547 RepID=UPI003EBD51E6